MDGSGDVQDPGEAEVGDDGAVAVRLVQQHVARLQAAVHDPGGVGVRQGAGDLLADPGRALPGQVAEPGDLRAQRRARDQPHDDPGRVVLLGHVVDRDDGGVIWRRAGPGRPGHGGQQDGPLGGRPRREQYLLDRHRAVEGLVTGAPHPARAALAHRLAQRIAAANQDSNPTWHSTDHRNGREEGKPHPFGIMVLAGAGSG